MNYSAKNKSNPNFKYVIFKKFNNVVNIFYKSKVIIIGYNHQF